MPQNIALVGCGAMAQKFYLAALAKRRFEFDQLWVVDPNEKALTAACAIVNARPAANLSDISEDLHFVIVATPNDSHFSSAQEALSRQAHVLIEKPFVSRPESGRELIKLAGEYDRVVAVNQTRRFFPNAVDLRRRIAANEFGLLRSIVHNEGYKLMWPFSSGASFAKNAQRTGVIMDIGVHVIDFYQYILQPRWTFESAVHDGFCGPEGLAALSLKADDTPVSLRLSRYQKQENVAHLHFEDVEVQVNIADMGAYCIKRRSSGRTDRVEVESASVDFAYLSDKVLTNFLAAGEGSEKATCDAASSLPVIEILDQIYNCASRYPDTPGAV